MLLSEAKSAPENLPAMENVPRARVSDVGGEDGSVVASSAMKKAHADLAAKWVLAEDGRTACKAISEENKRKWPHATTPPSSVRTCHLHFKINITIS